jgi:hypothetical protein
MNNRPASIAGGSAYYVCRPLSDKHKTLTLCVLCAFAVKICQKNNELIDSIQIEQTRKKLR